MGELGCQKYLLRGQLERYRRDVGESVHRSEVYERRLYLVAPLQGAFTILPSITFHIGALHRTTLDHRMDRKWFLSEEDRG